MNNLFYDCGEAAIKFPTRDNDSQGNLYVKMPGGYLRILYPAPENCLDLDAWREFYGFDREGQEGWFNVNVDTEKLTLEFAGADSLPEMRHHGTGRQKYVTKPEEVLPVAASMETADDFYGPYMGIAGARAFCKAGRGESI